ncbi:helicase RepA family protein [bacterium]|nr:helicase RepA family protein [bacterium]MBU1958633.1 helicase RepA family protein [bacterium]
MKIQSKKLSEVDEVIQEFILEKTLPMPKNTITMISAKGGVGKTNLALYIAAEFITHHTGNVGMWLTEDEEGNIKHRINTLKSNFIIKDFDEYRAEIIVNNPEHFAKIIGREFLQDEEIINDMKLFCIENDIRLLVLDPLLAFFGGNENDNGQARTFMQPFINWCKEIDINIIFIHHASKGEITNTRGAGAFNDAVRCAYTVSFPHRITEKGQIEEDRHEIAKGMRSIHCSKDNRGAIAKIMKNIGSNPFNLQLVPSIDEALLEATNNIDVQSFVSNSIRRVITVEETTFNDSINMAVL